MNADDLVILFNKTFQESCNTILIKNYPEPEYLPAQKKQQAEIRFRENFSNSALHEIAHWCIAGKERLNIADYGYWYSPDGRSKEEQESFYQVEVKPQSIEWIFSLAANLPFNISADNLDGDQAGIAYFTNEVKKQTLRYLHTSMPKRAEVFFEVLYHHAYSKKPNRHDRNTLMDQVSQSQL